MRWFKHLTGSWHDEKLAAIVAENGLEIYGFWWRILEIIGTQMNGSESSKCEYSIKVWSKFSGVSAIKFVKLAGILEENNLISIKNCSSKILINVPNLVKYRDEYTRKKDQKSGECQE